MPRRTPHVPMPAWSGVAPARYRSATAGGRFIVGKPVGAFVPGLTRKAFEKFGFSTASLILEWPRIAGADMAHWTVPERVKWPVRPEGPPEGVTSGPPPAATLILRVDPARALDAEYRARQIIERINAYFGYRAIAELRLLQAPLPQTGALAGASADRAARPLRGLRTSAVAPGPPAPATFGDDPLGRALARLEAHVRGA